jgi:hypothetical protein
LSIASIRTATKVLFLLSEVCKNLFRLHGLEANSGDYFRTIFSVESYFLPNFNEIS